MKFSIVIALTLCCIVINFTDTFARPVEDSDSAASNPQTENRDADAGEDEIGLQFPSAFSKFLQNNAGFIPKDLTSSLTKTVKDFYNDQWNEYYNRNWSGFGKPKFPTSFI